VLFGIVAHLVGHLQSLLGILTGSENDYQQLADQKIWLNP
jgi:hypothetical protein